MGKEKTALGSKNNPKTRGTGPGYYKTLKTADGGYVITYSDVGREDAIQKILRQTLSLPGKDGEYKSSRPFNQGRIDELYPYDNPPGPMGGEPVYDITPGGLVGGGPHQVDARRRFPGKAWGGMPSNALDPDTEFTWQDVMRVMGEGTTIQGSPETAPLNPIPGTNINDISDVNYGSYSPEQMKALAAIQQMTGATPLNTPGMFPQGATTTDSDLIKLGDSAYQGEIVADLPSMIGTEKDGSERVGVDFQTPFPTTYLEDVAIYDRIGFTPPNRQKLAGILEKVISGENPEFETAISKDPGHPSNNFLWARRAENDPWQVVDFGLWEEMLASGPRIVGGAIGALGSNLAYGRGVGILGRAFPWTAKGTQSLGNKIYEKLVSPGASKVLGRGSANAVGAMIGEGTTTELQELALSNIMNTPPLTWEERRQEAIEIAATNALGEAAGGLLIASGKRAFNPIIARFAVAPDAVQGAMRIIEKYNLGPDIRPSMLSSVGRFRMRRMRALTSPGQRESHESLSKGLLTFKAFRDDLGDIYRSTQAGGAVAGAAEGAMRSRGHDFGQAVNLVQRINKSMERAMLKSAGLKKSVPLRDWDEIIKQTEDNLKLWDLSMQDTFAKLTLDLDDGFSALNAHWDLTPFMETATNFTKGMRRFEVINPRTGEVLIDPATKKPLTRPYGAGLKKDSDLSNFVVKISQMPIDISGPGSYRAIRDLLNELGDIVPANKSTEGRLKAELQTALRAVIHDPKGLPNSKEARAVLDKLDSFGPAYASYKKTSTLLEAHIIKQGTPPEEIGRTLIDPQNQPSLVKALYDVYHIPGAMDKEGWAELQKGYVQTLVGGDPANILKLVRQAGIDEASREQVKLLLPRGLRAELGRFAQMKEFITKSPEALELLGDVTRAGRGLISSFDGGDPTLFGASLQLLKKAYPDNDEWKKVAVWGILDHVLMDGQSFINNKLILDKGVIKKRLTSLRTKGIFNDLLSDKELRHFDDMLSYIDFLPDIASGDVALGMSGQTLAKETMLVPNPLRPVSTVKGRMDVITNAINARLILDGWFAGPVGMGKGRITTPLMKSVLGHLISAENKVIEMGKRYHPGRYEEGSAASKWDDIIEANLIFVPGVSDELRPDDPARGQQELRRQMEEFDEIQRMWLMAPAWERRRMEAEAAAGDNPWVTGPAAGDFSDIPNLLK